LRTDGASATIPGGEAMAADGPFEPVPRAWFDRPTLELAAALLGTVLVHDTPEGLTAARIVEVEAYRGPHDQAAHSYGGRRTARTEAMFWPPGHAYIYRIYGMYCCFDVVSAPDGHPEAVLVRAVEPLHGLPLMARRRSVTLSRPPTRAELRALGAGPGRLAQALGITMAQYGLPLWEPPLYIAAAPEPVPPEAVATGPRVNIGYAGEATAYPWRFWIRDHPADGRAR
jgi:DNA-3-methyladenine glycosylase